MQAAAGNLHVLKSKLYANTAIDSALRDGVPVWKKKTSGAQRESAKIMLALMKEIATLVGAKVKTGKPVQKVKQQGVTTA
ncbi:hypothetical protein D3C81_1991130 [compost metagenome]